MIAAAGLSGGRALVAGLRGVQVWTDAQGADPVNPFHNINTPAKPSRAEALAGFVQ